MKQISCEDPPLTGFLVIMQAHSKFNPKAFRTPEWNSP